MPSLMGKRDSNTNMEDLFKLVNAVENRKVKEGNGNRGGSEESSEKVIYKLGSE